MKNRLSFLSSPLVNPSALLFAIIYLDCKVSPPRWRGYWDAFRILGATILNTSYVLPNVLYVVGAWNAPVLATPLLLPYPKIPLIWEIPSIP
jgi:hypothetical protein